jgi:3-oxoadipate enol-lactonase
MSRPERSRLSATLTGASDAPVLVLGNSLGTTSELWRPQEEALAEHYRLLRFDHPGHGGSPARPGPYTIAGLGRDVLRLLDEFGIPAASYCGVSLGGMIGMWLAANAPERIAGLGLCCTSAYLPPASGWLDRAALVRAGGTAAVSDLSMGRWFTDAFRSREPGTVARFRTALEEVAAAGYAGCCEAIAEMDLRPSLGQVRAPTLVIAGAEDPVTPPWHGAVIAAAIPGARLRVIRGASHLANVSQPGEVNAALLAHLAAVTRWRMTGS